MYLWDMSLQEFSFDNAKQEALDYIEQGEDKPGCIVKEIDSVIGERLEIE
jgi:hypothetical protein